MKMNKLDKYFLLTWRKLWILVVGGFISILLHNFWYAIFGFEEAVFLVLVALIIPVYFLVLVVYSLIKKIKKNGRK
jgi:hypothetical protein